MKFLIYLICLLPPVILEVVLKEAGIWQIAYGVAYQMHPDTDVASLMVGLFAGAVTILLYAPAIYLARKWIAKRDAKQEDTPWDSEPPQKKGFSFIALVGIAILLLALIFAIVPLVKADAAWVANFCSMFSDILVAVGLGFLVVSIPFSLAGKDLGKILRLSGFALFVIGLCVFYVSSIGSPGYAESKLPETQSAKYEDRQKTLPRPASGTILAGKEYTDSEITVTASTSHDYVVSLKDMLGYDWVSFYVRAGETVTIGVPPHTLYVYFASGKEWYGYGKGLMFGEDTTYSKDDEMLNFSQYSWEYTLYPVTNGNFSETPCDENDFF